MRKINTIIALSAIIALSGCGGSSSSDPAPTSSNPPPTSGIGRTGIAVGPISTFGSVVVNGVRYNTDNATFTIDGMPATQADLKVGQVVVVSGSIDDDDVNGTADDVSYDDDVTGTIESIDAVNQSFVVLGQTVLVDEDTSFEDEFVPSSFDGLAVGQRVEVSGLFDANGAIVATRIEREDGSDELEVHGVVANLDTATQQFELNTLVVDYSGAMLEDFPNNEISEGDFVEAKGRTFGAAGELIAEIVEREDDFDDLEDGDNVEIEGFITRFAAADDFDVAGLAVTTNASTEFEGGSAADLGLNIKVEVEGRIDANGVLVASEVEIRRANAARVTAQVDSVDTANDSLVVLGIPVTVDVLTRLEDKSDAELQPLTLNDINVGDYIEVRGAEFPAESNEIVASQLERDDLDSEVELQGFVDSIAEPAFSVLGVTVETGSTTVFRTDDDTVLTASEFFALLSVNDLVEIEGIESSDTTIIAAEVEFEDED